MGKKCSNKTCMILIPPPSPPGFIFTTVFKEKLWVQLAAHRLTELVSAYLNHKDYREQAARLYL